ncbi:polysaccharide biosynthesis tyrosine autokinase [Curtobacterium sp. MCSS17_015]|uniref:polysaccharide biosynthesis tyrosine autokinase n=1 Tax=Curtobacterium sp. MCSS17_015 TaxID=2175666 RepID=UPI0015E8E569|nr:polysaccharide biosynthesis tyrosine autokinase [Curtobacterium sp. MCSS17_015]WIB26929.1 polysaccharide biosynthesis tyrosine autokinase [Curtobacterium sp. MCSS17_015]
MTASQVLRIFRRSWLLIVAAVLLGTAVGTASALVTDPSYRSDTRLFVAIQPTAPSTTDLVQGNSAAQQKVTSYVAVVTSARVLQPVIDELRLDTNVSTLARSISANSPLNSVLLDVSVRADSPDEARRIAGAVAKSLTTVVTEQLEKPTAGGASLVKIESIQPPTLPQGADSPNLPRRVIAGAALGLLAGVAAAALRHSLDTRVRTQSDIEAITDAPVLGAIGHDADADRRPLIVHADPRNPRAESFRSLRTNVQFLDLDQAKRSFTVTSAVPAEGKSTTAANLAIAMAENGARVVLVDADLRRPRVAEILGIDGSAGLTDVLIGKAELDDVTVPWGLGGLNVLPAGRIPPNPSELLGSASMQALMHELELLYDTVIVDAPPLLPVTDAAVLSRLTSGSILITALGRSTRHQLRAAFEKMSSAGARTFGIVMTMVRNESSSVGAYGTYDSYYGDAQRIDESVSPAAAPSGRRVASAE